MTNELKPCSFCNRGAEMIDESRDAVVAPRNTRMVSPSNLWQSSPPTEPGLYWFWGGDYGKAPAHVSVLYLGSAGKCFISGDQLGIKDPMFCDQMGGHWQRIPEPSLPEKSR